jgi:hypothetical protein
MDEIETIIKKLLCDSLQEVSFLNEVVRYLLLLRQQWTQDTIHFTSKERDWEMHAFFRLVEFIRHMFAVGTDGGIGVEVSQYWNVIEIGTRYMYLSTLELADQNVIISRAREVDIERLVTGNINDTILSAANDMHDDTAKKHTPFFELTPDGEYVRLWIKFLKLKTSHKIINQNVIDEKIRIVFTSAMVSNIMRIFAAVRVGSALLLEGPPGVGKTEVVRQVAQVLGYECVRINLSANSTLEQLFGSYVPRFQNGVKGFVWKNGQLTEGILQKSWILLDEINLAPAEVLDSLAPLLLHEQDIFPVPGNPTITLRTSDVRVFATMNPVSVGGGI